MLTVMMLFLIYVAINNKRFFPRIRDPEELRARLAGEYKEQSDDDISISGYSNISQIDEDLDLAEALYLKNMEDNEKAATEALMHEEAPIDSGLDENPYNEHEKKL